MRYSIQNYVDAFTQALKKEPQKDVVSNFIKLLQKNGDIKNFNKIMEAIHKNLVADKGGRWVGIETAREISTTKRKSLEKKFSKADHVDFKINAELVAGVRITINGEEELNNSLDQKLKRMFK